MSRASPTPTARSSGGERPVKDRTEWRRSAARHLLRSEEKYFEIGAVGETLDGGRLGWMPGLCDVPAACVVHVRRSPARPHDWLHEVEGRLRELGVPTSRIYTRNGEDDLARALVRSGYTARRELGFVAADTPPRTKAPSEGGGVRSPGASVVLERVEGATGWRRKLELHRTVQVGPDGHRVPPNRWVELERRKSRSRVFRPFLIRRDREVCGAVSTLEVDSLLRMKNLVVHPALRRRGVGRSVVALLHDTASDRGLALGCFAIAGGPGERLYRAAGLRPVTSVIEWRRPLGLAPTDVRDRE